MELRLVFVLGVMVGIRGRVRVLRLGAVVRGCTMAVVPVGAGVGVGVMVND